jgi:superoxide dismutase, Cu-Zn family
MKLSAPLFVLAAASATALFAAPPTRAVAVLHPTAGSKVEGQVTFAKSDGGVKISAHVTGLTPGKHGFHIHEFGDCTAADGTSAGGHFNPAGAPHGAPTDAKRHEGDLGNIEANASGVADLEYVDSHAGFEGETSILGRGVIVHAGTDDFKTQPTGNAGGRVACGVIGVAKAQ